MADRGVSKRTVKGRRLEVTSPFDGRFVADIKVASEVDVESALSRAHQLFRARRSWLAVNERIGILERAARIMTKRHGELVALATTEGGKPLVDSQMEVTRAIDSVRLCVECLRSDAGSVVPIPVATGTPTGEQFAFTRPEPVGVVVAVSAFNHPLNLIVHQVAPAVAAGCPVIVKPADVTPLSCLRFVEILIEAGLPEHWAQVVVTDDNALAEKLVVDPRVGFFSFIGSSRVGWMLRSKLAPGTRCALEHGGVAPVVLAKDADLDLAIARILKGGFYHAGQVCGSVQRVYAPVALADTFAARLAGAASELVVGDPMNANTQVGPLIRRQEVRRVHTWVQEATAAGAVCLTGGEPINERLYACTVLQEPPATARISQMEVFGPVVNVYGYSVLSEAIEQANSLPFAFQAAVFTRDLDLAMHMCANLDASAVMINDHTAFRVDGMPFAGLRESGLGVGGIPYTMQEMQIQKMLVINAASPNQRAPVERGSR